MIVDYQVTVRKGSIIESRYYTLYTDTGGDNGYAQKSIMAELELRPVRYKASDGMRYRGQAYKLVQCR